MRRFAAFALGILTAATPMSPLMAQEREMLGNGRLFNNDYFGDGRDRWRTGSYVFSHVRGPRAYVPGANGFGEILEYRLRGEIIAPRNISTNDRPYVGALSLGAHTHFGTGTVDYSLGADVVLVGPQTGLADFQDAFHDAFGLKEPAINNQLADDVFISGTAQATYRYNVSETVSLRPFVEATAGVEDLFRVGGDVIIGSVGQQDLMLRDVVTGQLYRGTNDGTPGVSYVNGADIAAVSDSAFLPADEGYVVSESRTRARAGVMWQASDEVAFFYGVTYLSEEYDGQPEGQVVGSLRLNFNF